MLGGASTVQTFKRRLPVNGQSRMTIEEVVRAGVALRNEHADVIRGSVRLVAQEMMEAEVSELVGAKLGERTEDRATNPNDYRLPVGPAPRRPGAGARRRAK
jgi:hypothetical protein